MRKAVICLTIPLLLGACAASPHAVGRSGTTGAPDSTVAPTTSSIAPSTTLALTPPVRIETPQDLAPTRWSVGARITVSQVLTDVTPILVPNSPGYNTCPADDELAGMAAGQKWIGIGLTITNTGPGTFLPYYERHAALPVWALNGSTSWADVPPEPEVPSCGALNGHLAYAGKRGLWVGVAGCPVPAIQGLSPGATTSGCVAITVPQDLQVTSIGVAMPVDPVYPGTTFVQWSL